MSTRRDAYLGKLGRPKESWMTRARDNETRDRAHPNTPGDMPGGSSYGVLYEGGGKERAGSS